MVCQRNDGTIVSRWVAVKYMVLIPSLASNLSPKWLGNVVSDGEINYNLQLIDSWHANC